MTNTIDIAKLLPWSKPEMKPTANGDRMLSKAKPTPEFWELWRANKAQLREAGISVGEWPRSSGNWQACWWQALPTEVIEARAQAMTSSRATDAEILIPAPDGYSYLGYQRAGVQFMVNRYASGIGAGVYLGDEMGLGKTIQAIGMINFDAKIHRVLIVCPATLKYNWLKELRKWLTRDLSVEVADSKCFPSSDVVIINYDILHKFEKSLSFYWDMIVLDESHYLKNPTSRRTKCVFGSRPRKKEIAKLVEDENLTADQARQRLMKSPLNARRKLAMSGTPIENEPAEIFPVINWLDPVKWPNEFKFKLRYCNGQKNGFGWSFEGASHTDELNRELRSGLFLRRLKSEVLTELPPKFRKIVELPNDTEESRRAVKAELDQYDDNYYEKLDKLAVALELSKAGENQEAYKAAIRALEENLEIAFEEMAAVRHATAKAKLPQVIAKLKEIFEEDAEHKVIVFFHHRDVAAALKAEWPDACMVLGGMDAQKKMEEVNRFQNDPKATLFGGSLTAAGVGITLTASSHVIFIEEDWRPSIISQAEDRAHRIGQHDNVLVEHWVLAGSLDVRMVTRTLLKQEMIDSVLDERQRIEITEVPILPTTITVTADKTQEAKTSTFKAVAEAAKTITAAQIQAVQTGLRILAGRDADHAMTVNGVGFNKFDGQLGHELASLVCLTPKQAVLGRKICAKYVRQLGEQLVNSMKS